MLIFRILSLSTPYIFKAMKWLKSRKGLFLPILLYNLLNGLLSFLIKAKNIKFTQIIFIYFYQD